MTVTQGNDRHVSVYEVGLRDGLQNEASFVPTSDKIALAEMLTRAGLRRIELTSFVSPKWIPQLGDHKTVVEETPRHEGVVYSALVPNRRGLDTAKEAGIQEIAIFLSATETHTKKNINKSIAESLDVLREVAQAALDSGLRVRGYLSTVFGCPYEGDVAPAKVHEIVHQLLDMGVYEVSLGDTIGVATPNQVYDVIGLMKKDIPLDQIAMHMHDTRGTALANVLAGLESGIRVFDSAFGGLGGCPYAPGASGNLATEDLVYMLERMGYSTGVDLALLIQASERVSQILGRTLTSKVLLAELGAKEQAKRRTAKG